MLNYCSQVEEEVGPHTRALEEEGDCVEMGSHGVLMSLSSGVTPRLPFLMPRIFHFDFHHWESLMGKITVLQGISPCCRQSSL